MSTILQHNTPIIKTFILITAFTTGAVLALTAFAFAIVFVILGGI